MHTPPTTSITQTSVFGEIKFEQQYIPNTAYLPLVKIFPHDEYLLYSTTASSVTDKHISCCGLLTSISRSLYMSAVFAFRHWWSPVFHKGFFAGEGGTFTG